VRDVVRGVCLGLVALALGGALASRLGIATVTVPRSTSTVPWLLSRASAVTAFVALSLDVIVGLLVSTGVARRVFAKGVGIELHGWLSPLALALTLAHGLLLLGDGYVRFDALDLIVPFASSYRPVAVGLGVLAAYVAVVVHASFALRKRIGPRTWRRLHYLSFVALTAAALHALLAGTDAASPLPLVICAVPLVIIVGLTAYRIVDASLRTRRER